MKMKKGKVLTTFFSILPGAGHMYMGFMKMGLSFMSMFFFIVFLSSWLHIGPLLFLLPLIWFYSFFDCINKQSMAQEEFELIEDEYMFSLDKLLKLDLKLIKKRNLFLGILLVIFGVYCIWENIRYTIQPYIGRIAYNFLNNIISTAPQLTVGIAIIVIGIKLIMGKKKEMDENE